MARSARRATRLTIHVAEPHRHGQRSAVTALLIRAATLRTAGASVFAGYCGFGRGHHLHAPHGLHGPDETPLTVIIIDDRDTIDDLLRIMRTLLPHAFAVIDDVTAIRYARDHPDPPPRRRRWR